MGRSICRCDRSPVLSELCTLAQPGWVLAVESKHALVLKGSNVPVMAASFTFPVKAVICLEDELSAHRLHGLHGDTLAQGHRHYLVDKTAETPVHDVRRKEIG